jgi:hypothetical protein
MGARRDRKMIVNTDLERRVGPRVLLDSLSKKTKKPFSHQCCSDLAVVVAGCVCCEESVATVQKSARQRVFQEQASWRRVRRLKKR